MELAQKVSVSIDPAVMRFMQDYLASSHSKSRSAVVNEALRLLERRENERALESAYRQSAATDLIVAQAFAGSLNDGLNDEAW